MSVEARAMERRWRFHAVSADRSNARREFELVGEREFELAGERKLELAGERKLDALAMLAARIAAGMLASQAAAHAIRGKGTPTQSVER